MKPTDSIKKLFESAAINTNPKVDEMVFDKVLTAQEKVLKAKPTLVESHISATLMKSRFIKLAAAAVIIIAVLIGISRFGGFIDGSSVAWADISRRLNDVDYVHFYKVQSQESGFPSVREGWYAHGKLRSRSCGGFNSYGAYQSFDNGKTYTVFDRHNNVTCVAESVLDKHKTFFEAITEGIIHFPFDFSQFSNKTPVLVSSDFLIYDFDPPEESDWIEKISITVGRNSLMPIQIKTYYKVEKWYCVSDLLLFDYEEPEKPVEFFEFPTETKPPHGVGQVVLGGDAVEIELHNTPGIKKAIVRLNSKFDGPAEDISVAIRDRYKIMGVPIYFMEITFVIDEGYRSITSKKCPLWLDHGVKAALGKDNWPDGKYRNIRYTPVLRATDKNNEFILELSCWLRTKEMF